MDMMLRRLIGEDVELVTMLDPNLGSIRADPTQLEQVIVNLAVNARDAMPDGGAVTIETANIEIDDDTRASSSGSTDTGIGMTDAERQQLFEPFFTTKAGRHRPRPRNGLRYRRAERRHDRGRHLRRAWARRSAFSSRASRGRPRTWRRWRHGDDPQRGDETILLVEDEPVVRQLVAEILADSGYTRAPGERRPVGARARAPAHRVDRRCSSPTS